MSYHRHSNPFAALSITLLILGGLTAAGLYCAQFKATEQPGLLHGYFTDAPTKQRPRVIPMVCTIPQPDIKLSTTPVLFLSPIFPVSVAATDEELSSTTTLPLCIESSINAPTPVQNRQVQKQISEPTYTPPICQASPQPEYPAAMKSTRRRGEVRVRIHISPTGSPTAVDIISSTHIAFAQAAQRCILNQWKFIPARKNGAPAPSVANISIHFVP